MWFSVYLVIVVALVTWRWVGWREMFTQRETASSGFDCFIKKQRIKKSRDIFLLLAVPAPNGKIFSIKTEGWWERLLKSLGVATEVQIGDPILDDKFYFTADSHAALLRLISASTFVASLRMLFDAAPLRELTCDGKNIWIKSKRMSPEEDTEGLRDKLAVQLQKLAELVTRDEGYDMMSTGEEPVIQPSFVARMSDILCSVLMVSPFFWVFPALVLSPEKILSWHPLIEQAALFSAMFFAGGIVLLLVLLGRTSWLPRALGQFLIVGLLFTLPSTILAMQQLDIALDRGEPDVKILSMDGKQCSLYCTTRGKHSKSTTYALTDEQCTSSDTWRIAARYEQSDYRCAAHNNFLYRLYFPSLAPTQSMSYTHTTDKQTYTAARIGDRFLFPVHRGYLGFPWVIPTTITPEKPLDPSRAVAPPASNKAGFGLSDVEGYSLYHAGDLDGAKNAFEKGCEQKNRDSCFNAAEALWEKGDKSAARPYYEKSCTYGYARGCGILGDYAVEENNINEAKRLYQQSCDMGEAEGCRRFKSLP